MCLETDIILSDLFILSDRNNFCRLFHWNLLGILLETCLISHCSLAQLLSASLSVGMGRMEMPDSQCPEIQSKFCVHESSFPFTKGEAVFNEGILMMFISAENHSDSL